MQGLRLFLKKIHILFYCRSTLIEVYIATYMLLGFHTNVSNDHIAMFHSSSLETEEVGYF